MGIVCMTGSFAHYFTTRERVKQENPDTSRIRLGDALRMLLSCRSWIMNTLYILCYGMLNLLIMSTINYYATYVIGSSSAATLIMGVYLVISVICSVLSIPIDKKLGRRNTMISSALVYVIGKIWFIIDPFSMGAIMVNAVSVAYAMTIAFVLFNTNRNNISDLIEWQSHRRIDSMVSTFDNLASKLSKAGANLLMTGALAAAGFNADLAEQPETAIQTINALLGWVPLCIALLMLIIVFFHPIEKEMETMRKAKN